MTARRSSLRVGGSVRLGPFRVGVSAPVGKGRARAWGGVPAWPAFRGTAGA